MASPPRIRHDSLLARRNPRAKLLGFFLLLPSLMQHPGANPGWWLALALLLTALLLANLHPRDLLRQWWRLRWFVLSLLLLHGLLTTGQPLWEGGPPWPTRYGLQEGLLQSLRLLVLATMAWILTRVTSSWELLSAFESLDRLCRRLGFSIRRGLALIGFTLQRFPFLFSEAHTIVALFRQRCGTGSRRMDARLERLVRSADALLTRLFGDIPRQEEALRARGFGPGLPLLCIMNQPWRQGDTLLVLLPIAVWALQGLP